MRRWWDDPARPPNLALLVGVLTALAAGTFFGVAVGADEGGSGGGDTATEVSLASAEPPGSTTTEPAPRETTVTTTAAPTTTTPPRPGSESERQWIAVLASVPTSTAAGEADARHAAIVARFPDARRLDSTQWASLRPGYWVSYVGPFPTGDAVLAFCRGNGLGVPSQCYGRFLSTDPAHQDRIADG